MRTAEGAQKPEACPENASFMIKMSKVGDTNFIPLLKKVDIVYK
jgi:hypothetical protein